jgi:hypothetical protein
MRHRRTLAGLAWLTLIVVPARADGPLEPPDLSRYLRWGPVRARPGFVLANLGYDGNIGYTATSRSDHTATLSPRVEGVVLFGRRAFLTFKEQLDWTVYRTYQDQSFVNQLGSARLTIPFQRTGLYVDGALNDTKDRPADALSVRNNVRERRLGAGVLVKLGFRTDGEIGVVRSTFRYTNPTNPDVGQQLDRTERGVRALARYLAVGRTRITLEASEKGITFEGSRPDMQETRERRVLPGIDFGLGGRLSGTARWGWARLDSITPAGRVFSGSVGEARLAYRIGGGTTLQVGGRRDVGFSIYLGNKYFVNTTYDARVVQYVSRVFGVEAGAARGLVGFAASKTREDRSVQYDAGVRLRLSENALGRKVEYSLKATRWTLTSTATSLNQSRTVIGIGAVIGY